MINVSMNDLVTIRDRRDIPPLLTKMGAKRICEIGVKEGAHFNTLLVPGLEKAVAIDIWTETGNRSENDDSCSQAALDDQYARLKAVAARDRRVEVIKDFSLNACSRFADGFFDFVYIDADHTEAAVYADLNAWWSKVRVGGVLAGHDYCEVTLGCGVKFGVIEALARFTKEKNLQLFVDQEMPWRDWFIPKE